jgi:hypothetical protein
MSRKQLGAFALDLGGTLAAGAAHAGHPADVQWSVTIGSPRIGVMVGSPSSATPAYAPRFYTQPVHLPRHYEAASSGAGLSAHRDGFDHDLRRRTAITPHGPRVR